MNRWRHPVNRRFHIDAALGERLADRICAGMGSWTFVIWQTVIVIVWISLNLTAVIAHWDPYPFILLNLAFSTQAAYAAPVILLGQNRQAGRDRLVAEHDYQTDLETLRLLRQLIATNTTETGS